MGKAYGKYQHFQGSGWSWSGFDRLLTLYVCHRWRSWKIPPRRVSSDLGHPPVENMQTRAPVQSRSKMPSTGSVARRTVNQPLDGGLMTTCHLDLRRSHGRTQGPGRSWRDLVGLAGIHHT